MSIRNQVIEAILKKKLIAIIRNVSTEKLIMLTEALYEGGVRLAELTFSKDCSVSDEHTAENIRLLAERFKGKMFIGSGTVLNKKQVELTKNAGGTFVISPNTDTDVIKETLRLDMVSIPGSYSPSEIQTAAFAGADFIKIFPATALGPEYIKAIKAPFSTERFLAVGGINTENIREYLKSGVCGFGVGSAIINREALQNNDSVKITEAARKYISELEVD